MTKRNKLQYSDKFENCIKQLPFSHLNQENQKYLKTISFKYYFTFQELRILTEILIDFQMWNEKELSELWTDDLLDQNFKLLKKQNLDKIIRYWEALKNSPKSYDHNKLTIFKEDKISFKDSKKKIEEPILGKCPVASEKTLCCNLMTMDAVNNCGFNCSYCSIQSFFPDKTITFETNILEKLKRVHFNRNEIYHIGTGQSSDSLMWGNRGGTLEDLISFAKQNPNIILEFKTKSKNVSFLLENKIPRNIICTWSLNPQVIIDNEEHLTASLEERIESALLLAQKGVLVGFHFHPIIFYDQFEKDYEDIIKIILAKFKHDQVALISFGTLTFTKQVLKEIRRKKIYSKILQMPLVEASGKYSYPMNLKIKMFSFLYNKFWSWHEKVFFYLCMEEKSLWTPVFGFEFNDNADFESKMKESYMKKINLLSLS